jgi:NAD(P)-dependent dehydrogenase (short-subunit alcohol dehydrogenase family)
MMSNLPAEPEVVLIAHAPSGPVGPMVAACWAGLAGFPEPLRREAAPNNTRVNAALRSFLRTKLVGDLSNLQRSR